MSAQAGSGSGLTVESRTTAECRVITVEGRVDHTNADAFLERLTAVTQDVGTGQGVVIDLSDLSFITSAGLRALLIAHRSISTGGGRMKVAGLGGVVEEVFRIARFDTLLDVADTADDAVAQLTSASAGPD